MFESILPCPICKQSCHLNEIYTYQVKKNKRPNCISMRKFPRVKFICSHAGCGESYPLKFFYHLEMFECPHRSILCPEPGCQFINNVETVIIHSINCPIHLLYCAICKSFYNMSVLTHDCNVINLSVQFLRFVNIITTFHHPITRIKMFFLELIYTLKLLMMERKSTMICS